MNGGRHDISRCDEFDEAIHDRSIGSLESIERGSPQRLAFAAKLKTLRGWLWKGYAADESRKRRAKYHAHAATLRRVAVHGNPFSRLTCPAIDPTFKGGADGHGQYSDLNNAFTRFRLYTSIPWKVEQGDIDSIRAAWSQPQEPAAEPVAAEPVKPRFIPREEPVTAALQKAMKSRLAAAEQKGETITLPTITPQEFAAIVANSSPYVASLLDK